MRRCEVQLLEGLLRAILSDYLQSYPSDAIEVDRDMSRLSLAVQTRGLGVFLLDLPALGKHLDKCLASGCYVRAKLPLSGVRWPDSPLPRLFSGMMSRVFERGSGSLRRDVDVEVVGFLRQIYYFAKGYSHDCSFERTKSAVQDFYNVDREIRPHTLTWDADRIDLFRLRSLRFDDCDSLEDLPFPVPMELGGDPGECQAVRAGGIPAVNSCQSSGRNKPFDRSEFFDHFQKGVDIVSSWFGQFEATRYKPRHGRGAVSDLRGCESKYSFPGWSDKLEKCFPLADLAYASYAEWAASTSPTQMDPEPPSKLLTVPKTAKGPRLIASEPTSHQWCQQILLSYLVDGIKQSPLGISISLEDQEPSRILALRASQDGMFSTIDLSAASDRLSCWLVERFFRANPSLVDSFHSARTRWIVNGTKVKLRNVPEKFLLRKFTTMGSACTFPVQSIVFATLCALTILYQDDKRPTQKRLQRALNQVRVFGDDIIIPTKYDESVRWVLSVFGLKVNHDKSFSQGLFRESCGMDAFMGYDVTPAHLNEAPVSSRATSMMSAVDASNNFFQKGYWRAAAYIESTLPKWVLRNLPVVADGCGRLGLKSYCGYRTDHLQSGWDENTQQDMVKVIDVKMSVTRHPQPGEHDLFQYFIESPAPDIIWHPGRARVLDSYLRIKRVPLRFFVM